MTMVVTMTMLKMRGMKVIMMMIIIVVPLRPVINNQVNGKHPLLPIDDSCAAAADDEETEDEPQKMDHKRNVDPKDFHQDKVQ